MDLAEDSQCFWVLPSTIHSNSACSILAVHTSLLGKTGGISTYQINDRCPLRHPETLLPSCRGNCQQCHCALCCSLDFRTWTMPCNLPELINRCLVILKHPDTRGQGMLTGSPSPSVLIPTRYNSTVPAFLGTSMSFTSVFAQQIHKACRHWNRNEVK